MTTAPIAAPRVRPNGEAVAYAGLSLASVCWASAFIAGKWALAEMSPLAVGAWRYLLASLVLLPFALRVRRVARFDGTLLPLVVMIVCGGVLYQWLFLLALAHTSATNTSLLIALNPAFTTVFSPLIGERLDRRHLAGVTLALLGAVTVITKGDLAHLAALAALNRGDLIAIVAACAWASFNLASRRVVSSVPPSVVNCMIYAIGAAVMFVLGAGERPIAQLTAATPGALGGVAAMAVLSSVVAGQAFLSGVGSVGVNRSVVFVYLVPVVTAFLSAAMLDETFRISQAVGGAAVLAGVYWTTSGGTAGR
jgi:drug/metabolite transporter (DMT)-like permease